MLAVTKGGSWGWGSTALGLGVGVGVAAWGLGSLYNNWGYSSYANPYYYAQPGVSFGFSFVR